MNVKQLSKSSIHRHEVSSDHGESMQSYVIKLYMSYNFCHAFPDKSGFILMHV